MGEGVKGVGARGNGRMTYTSGGRREGSKDIMGLNRELWGDMEEEKLKYEWAIEKSEKLGISDVMKRQGTYSAEKLPIVLSVVLCLHISYKIVCE